MVSQGVVYVLAALGGYPLQAAVAYTEKKPLFHEMGTERSLEDLFDDLSGADDSLLVKLGTREILKSLSQIFGGPVCQRIHSA